MKYKLALLFAIGIFLIAACSIQTDSSSISTVVPSLVKVSVTPRSSDTSLPPTKTSTILPTYTATFTPRPTRTASPTSTITPTSLPLSETGPWLMGYETIKNVGEVYIANLDGSGVHTINIPRRKDESAPLLCCWGSLTPKISPSGGYWAITSLEENYNFELLIFKLPSLEPIRRIPLLSDAAQRSIEEYTPEFDYFNEYAPVLDSMMWEDVIMWSHNGRYLAFSGALDGPTTDVYVYDIQDDSIRRLTDGPEQAVLVSWSPDDQWILHQSASHIWTDTLPETDSFWVAAVDGSAANKLYAPPSDTYKYDFFRGWISNDEYMVDSTCFECARYNLRIVNIKTSEVTVIYSDGYNDFALAPSEQVFLLSFGDHWGVGNHPIQNGIYWYGSDFKQPRLILDGDEWYLYWQSGLDAFIAQNHNLGKNLMISTGGEIIGELPIDVWPLPSPDGQWIVMGNELFAADDLTKVISEFTGYFDTWLPDSTGFYTTVNCNKLYLHMRDNDWQAEYIPNMSGSLCNPAFIVP
jgi:hypothetical protein